MDIKIPLSLRAKIAAMPESSMGANRIRVRLADGREFSDVYVAWRETIIKVGKSTNIPFDAADIVEVKNEV